VNFKRCIHFGPVSTVVTFYHNKNVGKRKSEYRSKRAKMNGMNKI